MKDRKRDKDQQPERFSDIGRKEDRRSQDEWGRRGEPDRHHAPEKIPAPPAPKPGTK